MNLWCIQEKKDVFEYCSMGMQYEMQGMVRSGIGDLVWDQILKNVKECKFYFLRLCGMWKFLQIDDRMKLEKFFCYNEVRSWRVGYGD